MGARRFHNITIFGPTPSESERYTFSQLLGAWVIETEGGTLVVTEEEIANIGRTRLEVFEPVDETRSLELKVVFPEVE